MENLAPPSHSLELLNKKVEGLEKIACMFNGLAGLALAGLIAAALRKAFNRKREKQNKQLLMLPYQMQELLMEL